MDTRRLLAAVFSAVVAVIAFGAGAVTTRAARADAGPKVTCSSPSPCFEEDNTDVGPGLQGVSDKGDAVVGITHAKGAHQRDAGIGVLGSDQQSTFGGHNAGVKGVSTNGSGVRGVSTSGGGVLGTSLHQFGVRGISTDFPGVQGDSTSSPGVIGISEPFGVAGFGTAVGMFGKGAVGVEGDMLSDSPGDAILAKSEMSFANIFRGNNHSGLDVFVVSDAGNTTIGGTATVSGNVTSGGKVSAVELDAGGGSTGVRATATSNALIGTVTGPGTSILAIDQNVNAQLFRGHNSAGQDKFIVDDAGNVFAHSFQATLGQMVVLRNAAGQQVNTYSHQTSQASVEDFGEAQLVKGVASIRFDPAFAAVIDRSAGYLVVATPEGDCRGLYVAQRTPAGFTIRELQGGRSSVPFSYRIVAKPFGASSQRLPLATSVPRGFDSAVHVTALAAPPVVPPLKHGHVPVSPVAHRDRPSDR